MVLHKADLAHFLVGSDWHGLGQLVCDLDLAQACDLVWHDYFERDLGGDLCGMVIFRQVHLATISHAKYFLTHSWFCRDRGGMGCSRVVAHLVALGLSLGAFGTEPVGTSSSFANRGLVGGLRSFFSFNLF